MKRQVLDIIAKEIRRTCQPHEASLIAVDGRCASGKTTLAAQMQEAWNCNVIHMDDFFLRPEQRTGERLQQPGGNVDWERFREEVLIPFRQGISFSYRPYDCHTRDFREAVQIFSIYLRGISRERIIRMRTFHVRIPPHEYCPHTDQP